MLLRDPAIIDNDDGNDNSDGNEHDKGDDCDGGYHECAGLSQCAGVKVNFKSNGLISERGCPDCGGTKDSSFFLLCCKFLALVTALDVKHGGNGWI